MADDDVARQGAMSLTSFYNGIDSSRDVDPHLTALGHSYGSLTTSLALQNGTGVDDAILFGSPGLGTNNVTDLGLPPGHVFLEEAHDDPVADLGGFGRDPSTLAGVTSLATDARTLPDGTQGTASSGHSEYTDQGQPGEDGYRRTTATYNMATVVAGMPERAIQGLDIDRGDEIRAGIQRDQDVLSVANQTLVNPARFVTPSSTRSSTPTSAWATRSTTWGANRGLRPRPSRRRPRRRRRHPGLGSGPRRRRQRRRDCDPELGSDRAADMTEGLSGAADEVGDSVREVQDDVEDTVTDLGRGLLNLADHPPWWR